MIDFRGMEIREGSIIVYPQRQGSSLWMNEARVVGITDDGVRDPELQVEVIRTGDKVDSRRTRISIIERVAVVA